MLAFTGVFPGEYGRFKVCLVFSIVDFVGDGPERLCAIQPSGSLGNESKLPGNKLSLLGNKLGLLGNATPSEDNRPREDSTQVSDASNTVFSRVSAPVNASTDNTSFYNGGDCSGDYGISIL